MFTVASQLQIFQFSKSLHIEDSVVFLFRKSAYNVCVFRLVLIICVLFQSNINHCYIKKLSFGLCVSTYIIEGTQNDY